MVVGRSLSGDRLTSDVRGRRVNEIKAVTEHNQESYRTAVRAYALPLYRMSYTHLLNGMLKEHQLGGRATVRMR